MASALSLAATLLLAGCSALADPTPDYRYRLTVEVETPEGVKTGSSVIEVRTRIAGQYSFPDPGQVITRVQGEAVTVDLGTRGLLFALLRSDDNVGWANGPLFAFAPLPPYKKGEKRYIKWFDAMLKLRGQTFTLPRYFEKPVTFDKPPSGYPMLVRFKDVADPKSVERVDPDDMAKTFGKGVNIKQITVALTDDPVTGGIKTNFPWWNDYIDRNFDDTTALVESIDQGMLSYMSSGSFSTEYKK